MTWWRNIAMAVSLALATPAHVAEVARPNIVLLVVDTLRADHLRLDAGLDSYQRETTPNLASFSNKAGIFTHAISPAPWTLPANSAILAARHAHRVDHDENIPLPLKQLREAGYQLVSYQSNPFVSRLDQGFDTHILLSEHKLDHSEEVDTALTSLVVRWIKDRQEGDPPFFLYLGLYSPHWTYRYDTTAFNTFAGDALHASQTLVTFDTPDASGGIYRSLLSAETLAKVESSCAQGDLCNDGRLYQAAYDAEITTADTAIQRLLNVMRKLGLFNNAFIVITADHGENMTDRQPYFYHGTSLHLSQTHVPLMIKLPLGSASTVVERPVRTIDILPTILDYLKLPIDTSAMDGRSLLPLLAGDTVDSTERPVFSYLGEEREDGEGRGETAAALLENGFHLIRAGDSLELYDTINDPGESANLTETMAARAREMEQRLLQLLGE